MKQYVKSAKEIPYIKKLYEKDYIDLFRWLNFTNIEDAVSLDVVYLGICPNGKDIIMYTGENNTFFLYKNKADLIDDLVHDLIEDVDADSLRLTGYDWDESTEDFILDVLEWILD